MSEVLTLDNYDYSAYFYILVIGEFTHPLSVIKWNVPLNCPTPEHLSFFFYKIFIPGWVPYLPSGVVWQAYFGVIFPKVHFMKLMFRLYISGNTNR